MKNKNLIFISLLLLIGGGGAYYFWKKSTKTPKQILDECMKIANLKRFSSQTEKNQFIENIYEIAKDLINLNKYDSGNDLFAESMKIYTTNSNL